MVKKKKKKKKNKISQRLLKHVNYLEEQLLDHSEDRRHWIKITDMGGRGSVLAAVLGLCGGVLSKNFCACPTFGPTRLELQKWYLLTVTAPYLFIVSTSEQSYISRSLTCLGIWTKRSAVSTDTANTAKLMYLFCAYLVQRLLSSMEWRTGALTVRLPTWCFCKYDLQALSDYEPWTTS